MYFDTENKADIIDLAVAASFLCEYKRENLDFKAFNELQLTYLIVYEQWRKNNPKRHIGSEFVRILIKKLTGHEIKTNKTINKLINILRKNDILEFCAGTKKCCWSQIEKVNNIIDYPLPNIIIIRGKKRWNNSSPEFYKVFDKLKKDLDNMKEERSQILPSRISTKYLLRLLGNTNKVTHSSGNEIDKHDKEDLELELPQHEKQKMNTPEIPREKPILDAQIPVYRVINEMDENADIIRLDIVLT